MDETQKYEFIGQLMESSREVQGQTLTCPELVEYSNGVVYTNHYQALIPALKSRNLFGKVVKITIEVIK